MTEPTSIWIEAPLVCRHLRSKQFYMEYEEHSSGMDSGTTVPCWCLKTMKPVGPDDFTASQSECTPERSCFEADGV